MRVRLRKRIMHLIDANRTLLETSNSLNNLYQQSIRKNEEERFYQDDLIL